MMIICYITSSISIYLKRLKDPGDYENEVFDSTQNELNSTKNSRVESPLKFLKHRNSSKLSNSSLLSPKRTDKDDSQTGELNESKSSITNNNNTKSQKNTSINHLNEFELNRIIYEYAHELLKTYKIKQLFELFSNVNGLDLIKWLKNYQ